MSKPNAYTVQLTKKASGVLQMKLMIPGYEVITMQPKDLRDVAAGIEAMFAQAKECEPSKAVAVQEAIQIKGDLEMVNELIDLTRTLQNSVHSLNYRVQVLELPRLAAYGAQAQAQAQNNPSNYQFMQWVGSQNSGLSSSPIQHKATCASTGPAEGCCCQTATSSV